MTKIITTLPVSADALQDFKHRAIKNLIAKFAADTNIEGNFATLCAEFTNRFNADEWIYMGNKDVYYNNDIFGLIPNLEKRGCNYQYGSNNYDKSFLTNLEFSGFKGDLPTYDEAIISFVNKKHFRDGNYIQVRGTNYYGLTFVINSKYAYYNTYRGDWKYYGNGWSESVLTIPFFRFGKNLIPQATLPVQF